MQTFCFKIPGGRGKEALMEYTDSDKKLVWICLQCLKYTKFGQFIFKGIIKIIVTRRQF